MTARAVLATFIFLVLSRLFPLKVNYSVENSGESRSSVSSHQHSLRARNWCAAGFAVVSNCFIFVSIGEYVAL